MDDCNKADNSLNSVYQWVSVLLDVTANEVLRNNARPTIISRNVYIVITSMFNAWAVYDDYAVGTEFKNDRRRPVSERTEQNKSIAISYAAYRTLLSLYNFDSEKLKAIMTEYGLDYNNSTTDHSSAIGVGNSAAKAVLDSRRKDGSNQYGDEPGSNGEPYSDYTNYQPINSPDKIVDPDKWQPIKFKSPNGSIFTPSYLTPHWGLVKPFGLTSASQFRAPEPPKVGSPELADDIQNVIYENANLTLEKKAIVEYMRDGPKSTSQSGQWLTLAQFVSKRDKHNLDTDMKMFFSLAAVGLDAFIASWETKLFYNSSRPWTLVRHYCKNGNIFSWGGPGQGSIFKPASEWHPYSPENFITPPFPGYVSGHSTVSGASARILELFTGSDFFGYSIDWLTGSLTEEGFPCSAVQEIQPKLTTNPSCLVRLKFPTFNSVSELAGISRIYGGFHIPTDNAEGLIMGRKIAMNHWPIIQGYFNGTN